MVEKEGTAGEKDAIKAYMAAREESDHPSEVAEGDEVSSALVEKVSSSVTLFLVMSTSDVNCSSECLVMLQVDKMLQNLEKEIDDVDAIIGDRWKLLDR